MSSYRDHFREDPHEADNFPNNFDDRPTEIAVINNRDEEIRHFFKTVITYQKNTIHKAHKKIDILWTVSATLALMLMLLWIGTSNTCSSLEEETDSTEKFCME